MDDNIKSNIKEIKNHINELNNYFSYFQEIANSIDNTISIIEKSINQENSNSSHHSEKSELLPKPSSQGKHQIPNDYFIDVSFIQENKYDQWKEKLEGYSKQIAECRYKKQFFSFCIIGRQMIESAITVLFEEEYKKISENNRRFFDAYLRVEERYQQKDWKLPKIYFPISENTKSEDEAYKELENHLILWNQIKEIQKILPTSIEIICEMIQPDFYNENSQIKTQFFNIKNMNKIRNLYIHEDKDFLEERIEKNNHAKRLYNNQNKFSLVQKTIERFIKDVYDLLIV